MRNFINDVLFILGDKRKKLSFIFILFFALSLLEVLSISILAPYISIVNDPSSIKNYLSGIPFIENIVINISYENLFLYSGIIIICIFFLKTFFFLYISKKILNFTWEVQIHLREKLVYKYQNLKFEIFLQKNSSELVNKLLRLIGVFNGRVVQHALKMSSEIIILSSIFILLFYTNYKIMLSILLLSTILCSSYFLLFKKKLSIYGQNSNTSTKNALKYLNEMFSAFKEIKVLSKKDYFRNLFIFESKNLADYTIKSSLITISPRLVIEFTIIVLIIIASIIFVNLKNSFFDTSDLLIYAISAIRVIPSLNVIVSSISHIRYGKPTVDDLKIEFMNYDKDMDPNKLKNKLIKEPIKTIDVKNINFSFKDKLIYKNASLSLEKGNLYGISGASGSGKSTLVNILLGFYTPLNLEIYINKKKIENESIDNLFFYLPQDFHIFDNSLSFNISLSDDQNPDKLSKAIESAQLNDLLKRLPNNLNSNIGEKGSSISGGEKQRVAIARCFYHNKEILIFDESTSGLDKETEIEIFEILKKISKEKIIIFVSHRVDVLKKFCDVIYNIDNLKIQKR